ncbi:MAG: class I SAM-dependent methyltransferase [Oscillospiraceae bacterium]|jgi:23S rRNA (cytosine1962-C5)-methyltransferase|nr:class I SAM-dependent methyltransferase [Oscillospiraceae bacterium]
MRPALDWESYALLDCSNGERLERWGKHILIRPDPQVIWQGQRKHPSWSKAAARYIRSAAGGGHWEFAAALPEQWVLRWRALSFFVKPMGFKHTGLFPEQAANWALLMERIQAAGRPIKALNLFAYTGAATLACLAAGASVTHVDAAKGMVLRAKENARGSGLADAPVRWIVEDCLKFAQRELRRNNQYDVIILDPPSYGRGPGGEIWKLEEELFGLVELCAKLLSPDPLLLLLNSYSAELAPGAMQCLLTRTILPKNGGRASCDEIGLRVEFDNMLLPCGSTAMVEW